MNTRKKRKIKCLPEGDITRKEWLSKTGKYAVFTAASMMLILDPLRTYPQDSIPPTGDDPPPEEPG